MACRVTLTVGTYFGVYLPYLAPDFYGLTLIFGMPTAGVGGSWLGDRFWYTSSALNNPVKLVVLADAEGVGVLENGWVLPIVSGGGGFLAVGALENGWVLPIVSVEGGFWRRLRRVVSLC